MTAWISSIGTALPKYSGSQEKMAQWVWERTSAHEGVDKAKFFGVYQRSGVEQRSTVIDMLGPEGEKLFPLGGVAADTYQRSMLFQTHAAPLAAEAARKAGVGSTVDPKSITHLIVATCTGAVAPGVDLQLIPLLGLSPEVRRTQIGFMGCYAAMPALRLARDFVHANADARVLVVCVELCSLSLHFDAAIDVIIGGSLFGDGAAAVIVEGSNSEGGAPSSLGLRLGQDACMVVPDTADQMAWIADSLGFQLRLSPQVAKSLPVVLPAIADKLLGQIPRTEVEWLVHPGGPRILEAAEAVLGLPTGSCAVSRDALREAGNRSSCTILFILEASLRSGRPWATGFMTAFGPGLTVEALRIDREQPVAVSL